MQPRQDLISEPNDEEETQSASGVMQLDQSQSRVRDGFKKVAGQVHEPTARSADPRSAQLSAQQSKSSRAPDTSLKKAQQRAGHDASTDAHGAANYDSRKSQLANLQQQSTNYQQAAPLHQNTSSIYSIQ